MSNKSVSGLTHLLQGMAISMSDGKADADVRYVPVSNSPYVRIRLGTTWDGLADLRTRMGMELAARGFRAAGGDAFLKETDGAYTYIHVGDVVYDEVARAAYLDMSASGPYRVEQSMRHVPRDSAKERRAFEASVRRAEDEAFLRRQGAESVVNALLTNAPFKVPHADIHRIHQSDDRTLPRRIALAFAGQGLASLDDLIEAADLWEVLGREPARGPTP